jgi:NADH-ubiquinone oxidoreductase chain 5
MSVLFKGFVFIISSLVILYSDGYNFGDSSIFRFIMLVFLFVVSIIFAVVSPNVISILLVLVF